MCSKGCGNKIDVDKDTWDEMIASGVLDVSHTVCPGEETELSDYAVRISVIRIRGDQEDVLASMGDTVQAKTFKDAIDPLNRLLGKQWSSVQGMADIADQDDDNIVIKKEDEAQQQ